MPAKGKPKVTDAQRKQIAAARVAGKTRKAIAHETGLSEHTVAHQLADPRTATFTLAMKAKNEPQMARMFALTLNTMEADLKSKDKAISSAARAQFLRLMPLGDPPLLRIAQADNSGGDFTLEELLVAYRSAAK